MEKLLVKKIEHFLDKERQKAWLPRYERIVIVSDGNGNYLQSEQESLKQDNIEIV